MTNNTTKQVDALGFTRMEIANVRRCNAANKGNYKSLHKLYEKAAALKAQIDALKEQIKTWDAPVRQLALSRVGVELTSEEILLAHEDIDKFYELHPELRVEVVRVEEVTEPNSVGNAEATEGEATETVEEGPEL